VKIPCKTYWATRPPEPMSRWAFCFLIYEYRSSSSSIIAPLPTHKKATSPCGDDKGTADHFVEAAVFIRVISSCHRHRLSSIHRGVGLYSANTTSIDRDKISKWLHQIILCCLCRVFKVRMKSKSDADTGTSDRSFREAPVSP
jgi:hypothetical protein